MGWQKYLSYLAALSVVLSAEFLAFSLVTPQLRAQSLEVSVTFPPTSSRGAPRRTTGGGQRNPEPRSCLKGSYPVVTALTPGDNVITTVAPNPTLFWYIPQTEARTAEFVIKDDQQKDVYRTNLAIKGTPGVVKLILPATVSLRTGKEYLWELGLICDRANRSDDRVVRGVIERTQLTPQERTKLAAAREPLKKAEVYAAAGVWQETLSLLAQLRRARPNDSKVSDAWTELLRSVQLNAITNAPLVECCRAEPSRGVRNRQ
jgi:hypothetical protein